MLMRIADGVSVHTSSCLEANTIVVEGRSGALVVDPGLTNGELSDIATDVRGLGLAVVACFATHPDWDHALWHPSLGDAPRYATARAARVLADLRARPDWRAELADGLPPEIADEVPLELFGLVSALPPGATSLPWDGPETRLLEHDGHAEGHAAVLLPEPRVLLAGDMLSDVLVPMPDLYGDRSDPLGDYLAGLDLLATVSESADVMVPGHGSVAYGDELRARIARDRAYIDALRAGRPVDDPRVTTPKPGWEWVSFIHEGNVERTHR